MPRNDETRVEKGAAGTPPAPAPASTTAPTISLPRPTPDQENYLEGIKRSTADSIPMWS